jgi:FtsP/CotA-like multicopper oxidase with cupredoxin domain
MEATAMSKGATRSRWFIQLPSHAGHPETVVMKDGEHIANQISSIRVEGAVGEVTKVTVTFLSDDVTVIAEGTEGEEEE